MNQSGKTGRKSRGRSRGKASLRKGKTGGALNKSDTEAAKFRSGHRRSRGKKKINYKAVALAGAFLLALIALSIAAARYYPAGIETLKKISGNRIAATANNTTRNKMEYPVTVEGINLTGLSKEEAENAIKMQYPWNMKVMFEADTYDIPNLMENKIDHLMELVYSGPPEPEYFLDTSGLEEAVKSEVSKMASQWDKEARNGIISEYDSATDAFVINGSEKGISIDQKKLVSEISQAIQMKRFDVVIEAVSKESDVKADGGASGQLYKTISVYTTDTTAVSARNNNIDLAAKALNGTIIKPGEDFSFNKTVGERTKAKGYKAAAAYSNGEVVEEIGGGVCQLSTTLYNAVVIAGLEVTKRISHTFEPSYVTPGQDATVSWGGPDFCFRNNSSTPVGIRAFYSNRKLTVSIYGIPILEEGVVYSLKSKKLSGIGVPAPTYIEDPALSPGTEVTKKNGTKGSKWETRLVITKNGEVISNEVDHTSTYKGHAPVVARNTAVTSSPESSEAVTIEVPPTETVQPDTSAGDIGPGISTGPGSSQGQDTVQGPGAGLNDPTAKPSENTGGPAPDASVAPGP